MKILCSDQKERNALQGNRNDESSWLEIALLKSTIGEKRKFKLE